MSSPRLHPQCDFTLLLRKQTVQALLPLRVGHKYYSGNE